MVSEARTTEEVGLILDAAETGHLVLTSVRAFDTASALRRLLSPFSPEDRAEVRSRLARVLRWSFTQHLLPHRDGRRPAVEVWKATHSTTDALLDGPLDSGSVADVLRHGEGEGLIALDRVLEARARAGELELDVALASAVLPRQLEGRLLDLREPREGEA
jgi:twitching motility protein PilT